MTRYLKVAVVLSALVWAAVPAEAQPYYVRGDFNGWGTDNVMTDLGNGQWQATVTGLIAGNSYGYKVAIADWTQSWPGNNGKIQADATGQATFNFWPSPVSDGWSPAGPRVGYGDLGMAWDVMGAPNGWSSPLTNLTNMGNGLYTGEYTVADPGSYDFKFRKAGVWGDIDIGADFQNGGANANFTTTSPNQTVLFQLDLPNGRWQVTPVPEPATLGLLALGIVGILRRRRA